MRKEIEQLREEMKSAGIFAYIVCTDDFHGSEYVGDHFKMREFLSGFTGSAGTLVVTLDEAALWTDGRYFLQAGRQLENSGIALMKMGEKGVPKISEFLAEKMPVGSKLGFDGRTISAEFFSGLQSALKDKQVEIVSDIDLGDKVWKDRPPLSAEPVYELSARLCGASRSEKLTKIREKIRSEKADSLVTSSLDEIAWTLNLRGNDVAYNPVFLAFMIVEENDVKIFANPVIFSEEIKANLKNDGVSVYPYGEIYSALNALEGKVMIDPKTANCRIISAVTKGTIIKKDSPIIMLKAVKNSAEIAAEKSAHVKDGVAVTRFMYWLKHTVGKEKITEISAAEKLEEFRKQGSDYLGQSFDPIMAYGEHGAVVHYSATEETDAELAPKGMLLSDTGGQYLQGTTDITRTFVLGELTEEEKRAFTLVMAGHLNLLAAKFPKGSQGSMLDYAAREPLWQNGLEFNHGTGHGVGFLLNVHEGPQRISWRAKGTDTAFEPGMITSDEPGLYVAGKFGIRHESLVLCEEAEKTEFGEFLKFSPLTMVPFDRDGIEPKCFSERQKQLFNDYQKLVCDTISPLLPENEKKWLEEITKPI